MTTVMEKQQAIEILFRPREIDILHLLANWHTNDEEIALKLKLSKKTAHNYIGNIMRMTDIHNRVQLVRYAQEKGFGKFEVIDG